MSFEYAQIRRSSTMEAEHTSIITIDEFEAAVKLHSDITLGIDPTGLITINSSTIDRNKTAVLEPKSCFYLKEIDEYFIYYEFYKGIALHINKNKSAMEKLKEIAKTIDANVFFFN